MDVCSARRGVAPRAHCLGPAGTSCDGQPRAVVLSGSLTLDLRMAIIDEPNDAIDRKADACVVVWIADAMRDCRLVSGMPKRMQLDPFTAAVIADGPIRTKPAE